MKQLYINYKNRAAYKVSQLKRYLNRYTALEIIGVTTILLIGLWGVLSFIDIIMNNMNDCKYTSWNLINLLLDMMQ